MSYAERLKRIMDAASLKEPDRVPIIPVNQTFPVRAAGYTMAQVLYDFDKGADAYIQYAQKYEPDSVWGHAYIHMGMGPIFELMQPKTVLWAGAPDAKIDENSIHQYIEFPILEDAEMDWFAMDQTGWLMDCGLAKTAGVFEPFARFGLSAMNPGYQTATMLAGAFSSPEAKAMIEKLWKINDMNIELMGKSAALDAKLEELGYPMLMKGIAIVPFDLYSDFYRGTVDGMQDMFDHQDMVLRFNANALQQTFFSLQMQKGFVQDKFVFMPLHKGMDRFMSDEQYQKLYWADLQKIIEKIIELGMTPYIYTEGPYTTRLEFLKDVPAGKVIYHFEECDMIKAKKVLGDTACISGGFPVALLNFGTKQQVIDECKRLIDGCAAGGGYIFETSSGMDLVKPENIEAMFETVKTYGKK
ncbi:MAG: hypothetical protein FWC59_00600 [Actinomycetia bacterium]|nr:hypothetical protein [Actinomycetes bacterium]